MRGGLRDTGKGSVYVYFTRKGRALYVGQTSRAVKARLHDQEAPHKKATWWNRWSNMRFFQTSDDMDRLTLEFLLILAYRPQENKKPRAKDIAELFAI